MSQPKLVLGTRNLKKRDELETLLGVKGLAVVTLADYDEVPEVVEDGATFMANARKKAIELSQALGVWVLGEDSGLCVDAIDGAPGIYSARYSGEPCDDERNNDKLLDALADVPDERRTAHYVCTIAIADPTGTIRGEAEGKCHGRIIRERRGGNGFGYDPLFLIPSEGRTFGELSSEFKHSCSHRSVAVRELRPQVVSLLEAGAWSMG
ncbi:Non-canonical purine NTP pyrophosphatase [Planctomycetes bacterium Pan216]|uniref:dITP/XTP pyrophosphatase n=1 Tax=Kolteria novifilia TaxID=2527975 RepID=A0A518AXP6_9BACT|nr:Non-canonical purine NTP pyrophosphatase [Planctomycetes bacterium Pan216]